jgi:hypothetical protein
MNGPMAPRDEHWRPNRRLYALKVTAIAIAGFATFILVANLILRAAAP